MTGLPEVIVANWPAVAGAALFLLIALLWLIARNRKPRERYRAPDALDEGAAPAARNQSLIDAPSAATVAVEAAPEPVLVSAGSTGDDLARIKGLGPKLQHLLPTLGLGTYAQIAALDEAGLDALDAKLGAFAGRPRRDQWVEQARFLAAGDMAGFEGLFGKL